MPSYRCPYIPDRSPVNGPLNPVIQLQAENADDAVRLAKLTTNASCVLDVERVAE
jgi:hypothetical protein